MELLSVGDDSVEHYDEKTLKKVKETMNEIFLQMSSNAWKIATNKEKDTPPHIRSVYWEEAKWRTIHEWTLKQHHSTTVAVLNWALILLPIIIGYGLNQPSTRWPCIVVPVVFMAGTYVSKSRIERS